MKILNMKIIQSKYGISVYQTDHIIKNIIQEYWVTKKEMKLNFSYHHFQYIPPLNIHSSWLHFSLDKSWKNWYITWRIPKSLVWWTHAHHCPKSVWSSISHNAPQCVYEFTNRTCLSCYQTWHGISHTSSTWNHHVLKKENLYNWKNPPSMLIQSRICRNHQK